MNSAFRLGLCGAILLAALTARPAGSPPAVPPAPRPVPAEADLIKMLGSPDSESITRALNELMDRYPNSTNAIPAIKGLLKDKRVRRRAVHALGRYHAELDMDEVKVVLGLLRAYDVNEVMEGLKALRALKEPDAVVQKIVSDVLPLLQDKEPHVVRDACRTLAVLGNKETIPFIEPLLKDRRSDVRLDAQDAIAKIRAKP